MIKQEHTKEGMILRDDETGEIIDFEPYQKVRSHKKDKYIGLETKWPYEARSVEELKELAQELDSFHWRELEVNHWALAHSVAQGFMTETDLTIVLALCEKVQNWNVWYGHISDIPCHEKNRRKFLNKLSPYALQIRQENMIYKGDLHITINPLFVWKGDMMRREGAITKWYENIRKGIVGYPKPL